MMIYADFSGKSLQFCPYFMFTICNSTNMKYYYSENDAVAVLRIFVFNFNFDAVDNYPVIDRLKDIVGEFRVDPDIISVVPPGGSCEGGSKVRIDFVYI